MEGRSCRMQRGHDQATTNFAIGPALPPTQHGERLAREAGDDVVGLWSHICNGRSATEPSSLTSGWSATRKSRATLSISKAA